MLKEVITEEELKLMDGITDPVCLSECLFHNFDNLRSYDPKKFGHIRKYQLSMMSYESTVPDYPELSPKENFQLKENSGTSYAIGSRKHGKCEWEENLCYLANGKQIKFKNLIGTTQKIISLNQDTNKLEITEASFESNGIKNCYKLTTETNKEITVTENHPLLTELGWEEIKNIKGSFIATPRILFSGKKDVDENIAKLLGYLLGDGSCIQATIGFTNINKELIEEIYQLATYFDCELRYCRMSYFFKKKKEFHYQTNKVKKIVNKYNINKLSKNKTIPEEVFIWKNKYIAILLNRLFACDGHINYHNWSIEYASTSKEMIKQIQSLLLRFEIHSIIYEHPTNCNEKQFLSYRLIIYGDFDRFLDLISIKSKDKGIRKNKKYCIGDIIPNNIYLKNEHLFNGFKKKLRTTNFKRFQYGSTRRNWQRVSKIIKNKELNKIAFSDIYWEKIKKLELVGNLNTVIVSVPKNNTYISNGIISHNSIIFLILDMLQSIINLFGWNTIFTSCDSIHMKPVMDKVIGSVNHHPVYKIFKPQTREAPNYSLNFKNGFSIEGVNMTIRSRNPGDGFFGKHVKKLWLEEYSLETQEVNDKRAESGSELGCIERASGMTNCTKHSPAGRTLSDLSKKHLLINYPSYVNHLWDDNEEKRAIKKYGEKNSPLYKIYIEGEIMPDGVSAIDMDRVKKCYLEDVTIKNFIVNKDNYNLFKDIIIVSRPASSDSIFIASDIGDGGITEIMIFSEVNQKYKYLYNISLYNLTNKQQFQIFKYLAEKLNANIIALDTSDGTGRSIFHDLEEIYPKENLVGVGFNTKIDVDFEKDEKGKIKFLDNKPVYRQEYTYSWSIQRIKYLFYEEKLIIPIDWKLDVQLSEVVTTPTKVDYTCLAEEDHLLQALQVFAIAQWINEMKIKKPIIKKRIGLGV